ncbi:unnamed protein product [Ectocarpus sp. CCAP 1310/34]|nr:unnamed protein product [Ectocarpus sp. CCAP 1310/34]
MREGDGGSRRAARLVQMAGTSTLAEDKINPLRISNVMPVNDTGPLSVGLGTHPYDGQ